MPLINGDKAAPVDDAAPAAAPVAVPKAKAKGKPVLSDNSLLKAAEDKIESNLTPDVKAAYAKIVVAGNKAALNGGENSILAKLKDSEDPVSDAGKGAAGMVLILRKESKDSMPVNAMITAGATLMLHALDFVQRAKLADVGTDEIATATKAYTNTIFKSLGITPQMLAKGNETVSNLTKDPAVMEQMKRHAGLVKAPGTSTPVDVPTEPPAEDANGV